MEFEWDTDKNLANIEKHGVSFDEAMKAFVDPKRKIRLNTKHSRAEIRYYCIGMVADRVLTVRFTIRTGKVRLTRRGLLARRETFL